jgi:long-chain acyl-CoA synthetase
MWNFTKFSNNLAVVTENGGRLTYKELGHYCNELSYQINHRCLVFNLCSNTLGSLVGYLAFINAKIVPLMLNQNMDIEFLTNLIDVYKPDYLYVPNSHIESFTHYESIYSQNDYSLLKTNFNHEYIIHKDLALLLTTSGSTGSPNLVRQSYTNILANIDSIINYLELNERERSITTLPMNYTYGLSIINSHFYIGASIVLTEHSVIQKEFWNLFKINEVTSISGVPYTYEILDKLRMVRMELPSLKTLTQAGGKISMRLHEKFAQYAIDTNKKFIVMYGQTEATARMSYLPCEMNPTKYGSVGKAIPGGQFLLVDDNGDEINEPHLAGELVYIGDNVCLGYAASGNDLSLGDSFLGKLMTGDIAEIDAEGFYYIVGRKKRFLKIFGNRVNLDEIETAIKNHFNIECACVGEDNLVYICMTMNAAQNDILNFISKKISLNHSAFKLINVDIIPKNESGKILYKELERLCVNATS